ncbi:MAG: hypothetical protein ACO1QR_06930 [Chthoniobacteraceae bacterium]
MIVPPCEIPGLLPRDTLFHAQREEMFSLLSSHFEGVTRAQFERDLAEKNWVIEIRRDGCLMGFSTLLVCELEFEGQPITAIYSGDTIVAPEAWGSPALARTWIAAVNHLSAGSGLRPCYWLLLTSGFRTYRFLPVFWREFFPHYALQTPAAGQRLLDHLASSHYGSSYDPATGIVRFAQPQRLRGKLGDTPENRTLDPHIAFFLSRNPGHHHGDELVCITEISERNLTAAGRRMIATREQ